MTAGVMRCAWSLRGVPCAAAPGLGAPVVGTPGLGAVGVALDPVAACGAAPVSGVVLVEVNDGDEAAGVPCPDTGIAGKGTGALWGAGAPWGTVAPRCTWGVAAAVRWRAKMRGVGMEFDIGGAGFEGAGTGIIDAGVAAGAVWDAFAGAVAADGAAGWDAGDVCASAACVGETSAESSVASSWWRSC